MRPTEFFVATVGVCASALLVLGFSALTYEAVKLATQLNPFAFAIFAWEGEAAVALEVCVA